MKNLCIIGSTGCLGSQTLEVVRAHSKKFKIYGLGAYKNIDLLFEQIREFKPQVVAVFSLPEAKKLTKKIQILPQKNRPKIVSGPKGWEEIATARPVDKVVFVSSGLASLSSLLGAIKEKKEIAIATKELIVAEGEKIMKLARKNNVKIIPIDSEHSAIFQCIQGEDPRNIEKIILTCSGGPFYGKSAAELEKVTPEQALKHPTWKMGPKISIDSATLMNKGFEVIEAKHLFNLTEDQIEIVIHPESIIHSFVVFKDGSIKAQLSAPDMRIPISYALSYPERIKTIWPKLDLKNTKLNFIEPNFKILRGPTLAYNTSRRGKNISKKLLINNEKAVQKFLEGKIKFLDIYQDINL